MCDRYLRPDDTSGTNSIASAQFNWRKPALAGFLQFFTALVLYGKFAEGVLAPQLSCRSKGGGLQPLKESPSTWLYFVLLKSRWHVPSPYFLRRRCNELLFLVERTAVELLPFSGVTHVKALPSHALPEALFANCTLQQSRCADSGKLSRPRDSTQGGDGCSFSGIWNFWTKNVYRGYFVLCAFRWMCPLRPQPLPGLVTNL